LLSCIALMSCGSNAQKGDPDKLTIVGKSGAKAHLSYELADDDAERSIGLSGRRELDANSGMLFVLGDRHAGFWMKDTLIPLSVAFISRCGEIVAIAEMQPQSLEIHNTPRDYRFGLEASAGWFSGNGLAVGDQVQLPKALKPADCT
jgi:uncharacterized membrane protein (UPF0127 family)